MARRRLRSLRGSGVAPLSGMKSSATMPIAARDGAGAVDRGADADGRHGEAGQNADDAAGERRLPGAALQEPRGQREAEPQKRVEAIGLISPIA
jgi:hypothetical protein